MILPNKLITFNESIIGKISYILYELSQADKLQAKELYERTKEHFEDINQYIIALDVLFVLGKIDYNTRMQVVENVKKDLL